MPMSHEQPQSKSKLTGIHVEGAFVWDIHDYELCRVLLALPPLIPVYAVLYIESVGIADDVRKFLRANPAPATTKVYPGTIAPVPEIFHVPAMPDVLSALAQIADHHSSYEVCDHLHVYQGSTVLVQGYDFISLPLILSESFSEQQVANFCEKIGARYERRRIKNS
jgi:hypothetical protein